MRSEEFRTRWASHDVRFHNTGTKRLVHPVVGELTLNFERFDLAAEQRADDVHLHRRTRHTLRRRPRPPGQLGRNAARTPAGPLHHEHDQT